MWRTQQKRALKEEKEKEPFRRMIKAFCALFRTKEEKLKDALVKGDINRVRRYVEMGADVNFCPKSNKTFTSGDSLLHALSLGKTGFKTYEECKQVFYILRQGHLNINLKNRIGQTPLHNACMSKNLMFLSLLINERDIELNVQDVKGSTPLHVAVRSGDATIVSALMQKTKTFLPDKKGLTPLDYAGFNNVIRYLLTHKNKDWGFYLEKSAAENGCFFENAVHVKETVVPASKRVMQQQRVKAFFNTEIANEIDF